MLFGFAVNLYLMNILEKIIERKKEEVVADRLAVPEQVLRESAYFHRPTYSLKEFLLDKERTGIIAEFKRRSPSKGVINAHSKVEEVTATYTRLGASCLSVLTDRDFFGGDIEDLRIARVHPIPILRKDFIIDEYQILASRAMGADVILLIAACLSPARVASLARFAKELGMEVLLELHEEAELKHIGEETEIIGVNNRDLKTFAVDINRSIELSKKIPAGKIKIAESGIDHIETISIFKNAGFNGFLIGELFMKETDPTIAFARFVEQLNALAK